MIKRLRTWFRTARFESEMAEEMRLHLEHRIDEYVQAGLSPREARAAALRAFGGVAQAQEACRDSRRFGWIDDLAQDVRYGCRQILRNPGFAAVAIVTLALGIGANTAIYSIVDAVVFRPLPLHEPSRLMWVHETNLSRRINQFSASYLNYRDWRDRSTSWEALGAVAYRDVNLLHRGEPEHIEAQFLTANVLGMLRLNVAQGRGFLPEEEQQRVVIVSDGFWKRAFASDPKAVGRTVTIDGQPHTIVGVAPPTFGMAGTTELFLPIGPFVQFDRGDHQLNVVGRLKSGVTPEQAAAEMSAVALQIEREHPDNHGWNVRLEPVTDVLVNRDTRSVLFFLFGSVTLLLMIACANVSGLQLVRASARSREMAIRTALGGGRSRLLRQLVTESLLLSVVGGAAGLLVASWSLDLFSSVITADVPRADEIALDGRVLLFAFAITLLAGVIAGVVPALQTGRIDVQRGLKAGSHAVLGGRRGLRNALVVGQLALSIVLLAAAGLMLRTLDRLHRTELGFTTTNVLTLQVGPPRNQVEFFTMLRERVAALTGVQAVAVTSGAPMTTFNTSLNIVPVSPALIPPTESIQSHWRLVTAEFFEALQIPVLKGRVFTPQDKHETQKVIIVNRTLATMLWGDEDPIGKRVSPGGGDDYSTVIGVVGDIRSHTPANAPIPTFYMSAYRGMWSPMTLVIRTAGDPRAVIPGVRSAVKSLDPSLPVFNITTMDGLVRERVARQRATAALLAAFASIALTLAAMGIYGVMAYATSQRTREVGIRKALGARHFDVIAPLLRDGVVLVIAGTGLGLAVALIVSRSMRGMLTGVGPNDPLTFAGTAMILAIVTLFACYIPARRAARTSPLEALRGE
jgi:predicted permease